jgi:hypothetical protein
MGSRVSPAEREAAAASLAEGARTRAGRRAAYKALAAWARADAGRDSAVRAAVAAGFTGRDIQVITGIARTTIMRIMASPPAAPRPVPRDPNPGFDPAGF